MKNLQKIIKAQPAQDGAGVKINRLGGSPLHNVLNPFLMIDEIHSDNADDYIAGFPEHPHRGFETITYMKTGGMKHRDHMGNEAVIGSGDVQWMTAGRGVLHSEMPEQEQGLLHGFQLWLNLPAAQKMQPAQYREILSHQIPKQILQDGGVARVIAGSATINQQRHSGPMQNNDTQPVILDITLVPDERVDIDLNNTNEFAVYVYEGATKELATKALGVYTGASINLQAGEAGAQLLLLSGKPILEPIAQYGPFVMNTTDEIEQAIRDFNDPRFLQQLGGESTRPHRISATS